MPLDRGHHIFIRLRSQGIYYSLPKPDVSARLRANDYSHSGINDMEDDFFFLFCLQA